MARHWSLLAAKGGRKLVDVGGGDAGRPARTCVNNERRTARMSVLHVFHAVLDPDASPTAGHRPRRLVGEETPDGALRLRWVVICPCKTGVRLVHDGLHPKSIPVAETGTTVSVSPESREP